MKRSHILFIGILACVGALATAHRESAGGSGVIPGVRSESAGGNVSLRAMRGGDDEKERARARIREQEAGTYIPEILLARDSALARWKPRARPITVWVQSRPDLEDWSDDYVESVSEAFMTWDAVDLPIHFRMVSDSSEAEIHVTWIGKFNEQISGRTRWSRDNDWWIVNAGIVLAIHHQQGDRLDKSAMKAMALHEVGHLLGLDHTVNPVSIMAARVRVRDLAEIDLATARVIYSVPAGPLR